jgi:hypothetical protein
MLKEGWVYIDGVKCYIQHLSWMGWHYWHPETGWHKIPEGTKHIGD